MHVFSSPSSGKAARLLANAASLRLMHLLQGLHRYVQCNRAQWQGSGLIDIPFWTCSSADSCFLASSSCWMTAKSVMAISAYRHTPATDVTDWKHRVPELDVVYQQGVDQM
jgi:hypothetical protein